MLEDWPSNRPTNATIPADPNAIQQADVIPPLHSVQLGDGTAVLRPTEPQPKSGTLAPAKALTAEERAASWEIWQSNKTGIEVIQQLYDEKEEEMKVENELSILFQKERVRRPPTMAAVGK